MCVCVFLFVQAMPPKQCPLHATISAFATPARFLKRVRSASPAATNSLLPAAFSSARHSSVQLSASTLQPGLLVDDADDAAAAATDAAAVKEAANKAKTAKQK